MIVSTEVRSGLNEDAPILAKKLLQGAFAREGDRRAFRFAFEMLVVNKCFAYKLDTKTRIFQLPDLTILQ